MRRVKIKRMKTKFVGIWIEYWCVFGFEKDTFMEYFASQEEADDGDEREYAQINSGKGRLYIASQDGNGYPVREYLRAVPVRNGKTVEIEMNEQADSLFIFASTSSGAAFSDQATIPAGRSDVSYAIKTHYSVKTGTALVLLAMP